MSSPSLFIFFFIHLLVVFIRKKEKQQKKRKSLFIGGRKMSHFFIFSMFQIVDSWSFFSVNEMNSFIWRRFSLSKWCVYIINIWQSLTKNPKTFKQKKNYSFSRNEHKIDLKYTCVINDRIGRCMLYVKEQAMSSQLFTFHALKIFCWWKKKKFHIHFHAHVGKSLIIFLHFLYR